MGFSASFEDFLSVSVLRFTHSCSFFRVTFVSVCTIIGCTPRNAAQTFSEPSQGSKIQLYEGKINSLKRLITCFLITTPV